MIPKIFMPLLLLMILACAGRAQKLQGVDKSPMDMAYFPHDFAHDRRFAPEKLPFDRAIIRVVYSRPAKNGRKVFGNLVPYGEVWRNGANETPEIKFYEDVVLGGQKIKAGTYALLSIPGEQRWTLILSSDLDQWGAYSYDPAQDVVRVTAPVRSLSDPVEHFTIQFEGKGQGKQEGVMQLAWDQTLVALPFSF